MLLWGDVRLGNLVFDAERRVTAVLDWDLASLGPREMDLGWHFGLEFMMEALFGRRVPGFPGPAEARGALRGAHAGTRCGTSAWHEVFALVRALAINDRHQRITGDARRRRQPDGGHPPGAPGGGRRGHGVGVRSGTSGRSGRRWVSGGPARAARTP